MRTFCLKSQTDNRKGMITDEQLDKRVEEIMSIVTMTDDRDQNFRRFVRAALEVDRESLRLLEKLHNLCDNAGHERNEYHDAGNCPIEDAIEAHITTLRKRLGVEPRPSALPRNTERQ